MSSNRRISKQDLIRFRASFSHEQKIAIVGSLFRIAFADNDFSEDEVAFVAAICELLGYNIREDELRAYIADPLHYLEQLRGLREEQLIWYCRALYYLIVMDGKVDIREIEKLGDYLEILGIDHDRFNAYIKLE